MSKYDRDIQDVYAVKQLGDAIGYGHLMAIAHELWARHLESKGLPRRGAHCVVGYPMVKEQFQAEALNDKIYTIIVGKALEADRKTENSSEKPNNCEPTPWCKYCQRRWENNCVGVAQCIRDMQMIAELYKASEDEPQITMDCSKCERYKDGGELCDFCAIKDEPQTERSE